LKINKKAMLISWFIGVGFGLFFSGIILSILIYTSNKTDINETENQEQVIVNEDNKYNKETLSEEKTNPKITETVEIKHIEKIEEQTTSTENNNDVAVETIELEIKQSATAKEITKMLVENGVISDYDEFIAYIVSMDAERSLTHGKKTFPLHSDVETVFKILRPYK